MSRMKILENTMRSELFWFAGSASAAPKTFDTGHSHSVKPEIRDVNHSLTVAKDQRPVEGGDYYTLVFISRGSEMRVERHWPAEKSKKREP